MVSIQAGQWNWDGRPVHAESLSSLSRSTASYGPDGESVYIDGELAMLYRPYHSTSESYIESQPLLFAGKSILTWDGRLDNREDLTGQFTDKIGTPRTDAEIVAASFESWGIQCLEKLVGDWALALWNSETRELILARDYIGVRQLFYHCHPQGITWCTCLAPLCLCGRPFHLCEEYVAGYFTLFPDAHLTPYQEIRSVPPGSFVHVRKNNVCIRRYWAFQPSQQTPLRTDADYEERYRHLLTQSVRRRLRACSPILAELSGGLDSSAVVCVADQILVHQSSTAPRLDTFSYYDSNEPDEDDFAFFTKIEQQRNRAGLHVDLQGAGDSLPLWTPAFAAAPGFEMRTEVQEALSQIASEGRYRVLLCGNGGDEVNGQAIDASMVIADHALRLRFTKFADELATLSLLTRRPALHLLLESLRHLLPGFIRHRSNPRGTLDPWINQIFAEKYGLSYRQSDEVPGGGLFGLRARDALQTIRTMARRATYIRPFTIERRYPYLDQNLVEFLLGVPFDQLFRFGLRRSLMRRALAGLLPAEVLSRTSKATVSRCYSLSLQKHWNLIESIFISPLSVQLGYVKGEEMCRFLQAMRIGQIPPYFLRLLKVLSFELWLRSAESSGVLSIRFHQSTLQAASAMSALQSHGT